MAEETIIPELELNTSELYSGFWDSLPPQIAGKLDLLMDVLVIVLWVSIGYFVLLILIRLFRLIFGSKEARNLAKISKQLDITNDYLAQVVHLFKHDKGKEKTDVKGKKKKGKR